MEGLKIRVFYKIRESMHKYPEPLQKLITMLRKLPGVGKKTAERFAFQIISWKENDVKSLSSLLGELKKVLQHCKCCGALIDAHHCPFCDLSKRDGRCLCVVSSPKDIFSIESTGIYNGLYHVVSGLLSPLDDLGPEDISFDGLKQRLALSDIKEIILAFDSTIEGDATALFIKRELEKEGVLTSRLALGMPLGSTLDYLDEGTLSRALSSRLPL